MSYVPARPRRRPEVWGDGSLWGDEPPAPRFPCPQCGKETKEHHEGTRICSSRVCRLVWPQAVIEKYVRGLMRHRRRPPAEPPNKPCAPERLDNWDSPRSRYERWCRRWLPFWRWLERIG